MEERNCPNCNTILSSIDRYCPNCGAFVALETKKEEKENETNKMETIMVAPAFNNTDNEIINDDTNDIKDQNVEKPAAQAVKDVAQSISMTASNITQSVSKSAKAFSNSPITKNVLDIFKSNYLNPSQTIEKYSNDKYFIEGLIILVITGLLSSIYLWALVKKALVSISNSFLMFPNMRYELGLGSFLSMIPLVFIVGLIFAGLLFAFGKLVYRRKVTFKNAISTIGIACSFIAIALLLATILSFFSLFVANIVLIFGFIIAQVSVFISLLTVGDLRPNQAMYTLALADILLICIIIVLSFAISASALF